MKVLVNICSVIIVLLAFSSVTSAQQQQRPSQRSFATVLAKIKEKQSGRNKMQEQMRQPEDKIERPTADPGRASAVEVNNNTNSQQKTPAGSAVKTPDPAQLPSRQPIKVPVRPGTH